MTTQSLIVTWWARYPRGSSNSGCARAVSFDCQAEVQEQDRQVEELTQCFVPFFLESQRRFKWGGCPVHERCSLQVHVTRPGRDMGSIWLRCSKNFSNSSAGRCFYKIRVSKELLKLLRQQQREEYESLKMALARGSRD